MPARPTKIGLRDFPSQDAAIKFVRPVLNGYSPGERISGTDEELVRDLFYMNPLAKEKLDGHGISHFEVADQPQPYKTTRSFILVRTDGHRDDFSFMKSIRNSK